MRKNLLTTETRLHEDQSLIVAAFGPFGREVLQIVRQEFARLRVPADRAFFLGFDPQPPAGAATAAGDPGVPLAPFQADVYLAARENEALRSAVSHVAPEELHDALAGGLDSPAAAFVRFHRYDETDITSRMRALVDEARAKNPGGRIKCIVLGGMADAETGGMTVPFLFRIQEHLRHKKVRLEVFLATSEGHVSRDGAPLETAERNCAANAMLWEQIQMGMAEFAYPGKDGVREDRTFHGPLQQRTWIFSGGAGAITYAHPVVASIMANCIATLELTRLGSYLDAERVHYSETTLERGWSGPEGGTHPTELLAMNVAGVKADCFPSLFHLRAVREFIDTVSHSTSAEAEARIRDTVADCLQAARLTDDAIVEDVGIGARPVTREDLAAARVPQEQLHAWLSERLEQDVGRLVAVANGQEAPAATDVLLDRARMAISGRASAIANGPEGYLPGAILFYQTMQKHLESRRQSVLHRATLARTELGTTPNRDRLEVLLDRLQRDTVPAENSRFGVVERFVATLTVSVPTQVRKILDVAAEIRGHAQVLAAGTVLAHVYDRLARFCEKQREELQSRLYHLNTVSSVCMRDEELIQRSARSAFTYQRARFEPLVEHLWTALRGRVAVPEAAEVIRQTGGDLPSFLGTEPQVLERLLDALQVDRDALFRAADEILAQDPLMRDALKESLAQFCPTVQIDRDRFPTLETVRSRYVLCTRAMYDAHSDTVFEGLHHLETDNPFNVLVSEHEEGLPFLALTAMRRAQDRYRDAEAAGQAASGHPTAQAARIVAPLDA